MLCRTASTPVIRSRLTSAWEAAGVSSGAIVTPQPMPTRPIAVPTSLTVAASLGWKPAVTHMLITRRPSVVPGLSTHGSSARRAMPQTAVPASGWSLGTQSMSGSCPRSHSRRPCPVGARVLP
jgi:hypothetical protein